MSAMADYEIEACENRIAELLDKGVDFLDALNQVEEELLEGDLNPTESEDQDGA